MYQVYGDIQSGNCYKVKLLMSHLELAHEWHTSTSWRANPEPKPSSP